MYCKYSSSVCRKNCHDYSFQIGVILAFKFQIKAGAEQSECFLFVVIYFDWFSLICIFLTSAEYYVYIYVYYVST